MPETNKWKNCYEEGWQNVIVPEAFSHPAKMAYGLLKRILDHIKEQDWLREGQVILDPFGGIGSTGILGAYNDYRVVCVELEKKFVDLARQNFALHKNSWQRLGCPFPTILQGDSRRLCEVVEKADCIVSSPPFQESLNSQDIDFIRNRLTTGPAGSTKLRGKTGAKSDGEIYGQTPGQLGAMKPGKVDMVLSSPPYAESEGSPSLGSVNKDNWGAEGKDICGRRGLTAQYGKTKGQLGQEQGDTYWSAAKLIIDQCYQILRSGGHAIWVVKSFVRNKKIVDFPGDWQRLCESVGFKTVCIHHAMLVKETRHETLFGHTEVKRKERKSFFRRLAESKGSPRIDYEVVLCMEKQ